MAKLHVSSTANAVNDGTITFPYNSIAAAEAAAAANDEISIERGSSFRSTLTAPQSGVTYSAYGNGAMPKIYNPSAHKLNFEAGVAGDADYFAHGRGVDDTMSMLRNGFFERGSVVGDDFVPEDWTIVDTLNKLAITQITDPAELPAGIPVNSGLRIARNSAGGTVQIKQNHKVAAGQRYEIWWYGYSDGVGEMVAQLRYGGSTYLTNATTGGVHDTWGASPGSDGITGLKIQTTDTGWTRFSVVFDGPVSNQTVELLVLPQSSDSGVFFWTEAEIRGVWKNTSGNIWQLAHEITPEPAYGAVTIAGKAYHQAASAAVDATYRSYIDGAAADFHILTIYSTTDPSSSGFGDIWGIPAATAGVTFDFNSKADVVVNGIDFVTGAYNMFAFTGARPTVKHCKCTNTSRIGISYVADGTFLNNYCRAMQRYGIAGIASGGELSGWKIHVNDAANARWVPSETEGSFVWWAGAKTNVGVRWNNLSDFVAAVAIHGSTTFGNSDDSTIEHNRIDDCTMAVWDQSEQNGTSLGNIVRRNLITNGKPAHTNMTFIGLGESAAFGCYSNDNTTLFTENSIGNVTYMAALRNGANAFQFTKNICVDVTETTKITDVSYAQWSGLSFDYNLYDDATTFSYVDSGETIQTSQAWAIWQGAGAGLQDANGDYLDVHSLLVGNGTYTLPEHYRPASMNAIMIMGDATPTDRADAMGAYLIGTDAAPSPTPVGGLWYVPDVVTVSML